MSSNITASPASIVMDPSTFTDFTGIPVVEEQINSNSGSAEDVSTGKQRDFPYPTDDFKDDDDLVLSVEKALEEDEDEHDDDADSEEDLDLDDDDDFDDDLDEDFDDDEDFEEDDDEEFDDDDDDEDFGDEDEDDD